MRQLILFDNSHPLKLRIIAVLLQHANSNVPGDPLRWQFYRLKDRLLNSYGRRDPDRYCDWQRIKKPCWSCEGTGGLYEPGACYKCHGTGIYSERWIPLFRRRIADHLFHIPGAAQFVKPVWIDSPDIEGLVRHEKSRFAWHAQLVLGLMFDRKFARQVIKEGWRDFRISLRAKASVLFRRVWHVARRCDVCRKHVGHRPWCQSANYAYCSEECLHKAENTGKEVPF